MSKTGIPCYRSGGCGPYEMYSCNECPASKSDYLQRDIKDYPPYLDYPKPRNPMTNYDRLIRKTLEELAVICEDGCPPTPSSPICASVEVIEGETVKEHCQRCWMNWLKSPVEVEE